MKSLLTTLCLYSLLLAPASAQVLRSSPEQQQQLAEIQQMLGEHPELIAELHASLQRYIAQNETRREAMAQYSDWLYQSEEHPRFGPDQAEHTIAVFSDYNCPFCKRLEPVLEQLREAYPTLAVVEILVPLKQANIAGLDSSAAHYALRVWREKPSAFTRLHALLMEKNGLHDTQSLRQIAQQTDTGDQLGRAGEVDAIVEKNLSAFSELGLSGTPSLLIGERVIPGLIKLPALRQIVAAEFGY